MERSELVLSRSQSLLLHLRAGNFQLLLDQVAPAENSVRKNKINGAGVNRNLSIIRKCVHARNGGDVIWIQAELQSTHLILTGLDRCMWIESSLSLKAEHDKWPHTALERRGGIAELVLRLVASFIGR